MKQLKCILKAPIILDSPCSPAMLTILNVPVILPYILRWDFIHLKSEPGAVSVFNDDRVWMLNPAPCLDFI